MLDAAELEPRLDGKDPMLPYCPNGCFGDVWDGEPEVGDPGPGEPGPSILAPGAKIVAAGGATARGVLPVVPWLSFLGRSAVAATMIEATTADQCHKSILLDKLHP
mmetsp:Transcript_20871/g.46934  ORF Transcript_20871/g.46934 Transcript_20871/m.46934 type:complete len:106 (+) Transcript_20871:1280-1597(+)